METEICLSGGGAGMVWRVGTDLHPAALQCGNPYITNVFHVKHWEQAEYIVMEWQSPPTLPSYVYRETCNHHNQSDENYNNVDWMEQSFVKK